MGAIHMATRSSRQASTWKAFERLVAAIEERAAPRNATVTSPDLIRDLLTGRMREVDASIRFKAGTSDILVTIECRKRGRPADDTWIEQLATKRQKIGAAKTIAVSSAGFTKSAITSAKHHGIELRKLTEGKAADIEDWFLPHGVVHIFRQVGNVSCRLLLDGRTNWIDISDDPEGCLLHDLVHAPFPPSTLLLFLEMKQPKLFWSVPLDGTKVRLEFDFDGASPDLVPTPLGEVVNKEHQLKVRLAGDVIPVLNAKIAADVFYEVAAFESGEGEHHVYSGEAGPIAQHSRFAGNVFGMPVAFDHQSSQSGPMSATVQFPSGLKLPSQSFPAGREMLDLVSGIKHRSEPAGPCAYCRSKPAIAHSVVPTFSFSGSRPECPGGTALSDLL